MPEKFKLDPKDFQYVLNVVATEETLLWNLHEVDGTYRRTTLLTESPQKCVSSAVHKLEEALHVVGHHVGSNQRAIDLGGTCQHITSIYCNHSSWFCVPERSSNDKLSSTPTTCAQHLYKVARSTSCMTKGCRCTFSAFQLHCSVLLHMERSMVSACKVLVSQVHAEQMCRTSAPAPCWVCVHTA